MNVKIGVPELEVVCCNPASERLGNWIIGEEREENYGLASAQNLSTIWYLLEISGMPGLVMVNVVDIELGAYSSEIQTPQ